MLIAFSFSLSVGYTNCDPHSDPDDNPIGSTDEYANRNSHTHTHGDANDHTVGTKDEPY